MKQLDLSDTPFIIKIDVTNYHLLIGLKIGTIQIVDVFTLSTRLVHWHKRKNMDTMQERSSARSNTSTCVCYGSLAPSHDKAKHNCHFGQKRTRNVLLPPFTTATLFAASGGE